MLLSEINLTKIIKSEVINLHKQSKLEFNKNQFKLLHKEIIRSFKDGKFQSAKNGLFIAALVNKDETLALIKSKGLFRYSSYTGTKSMIKEIASELLEFLTEQAILDATTAQYLETIILFSFIHKEYTRLRLLIFEEIRLFDRKYPHRSLVKTLIANVEFGFLNHHIQSDKGDMSVIESRSIEQISTATSYLIYLLSTIKKIDSKDAQRIEKDFILSKDINRMIIAASYIDEYKEMEVQIDHYGYYLIPEGDEIRLMPPSEEFEKSMRLGFIRTELQSMNTGMYFVASAESEKMLSIESVAEEFLKVKDFVNFQYTETGDYPRYRLAMPDFAYALIFKRFARIEGLFQEELYHLAWITKEQLISLDDLDKIKIKDNLTILDFFKIKRIFRFMLYIYQKKFEEIGEIRMDILLHTILPTINYDDFFKLFSHYFSEDTINDFLDVVSWEPYTDTLLDLQYRPLVILENDVIIPLFLMDRTNVIRNIYASEHKNQSTSLVLDGKIDPLADALSECLNKCELENYKQVLYSLGEIDLILIIDDTMILIECKHSLQPASVYEMRTTYDHVQKANKQLSRALDHHKNGKLIPELQTKLPADLNKIKSVLGLVVSSNRILSGNSFEFPVRDINELMNFISKGTFVTNEGEYALWESEHFSLHEFLDYLIHDNKVTNHMKDVMEVYEEVYQSGKIKINHTNYYVEMFSAMEKLKEFTKDFRKIE